MNITLKGTHLTLTDDLRALVEEKIEDSLRALGNINDETVRVKVELEVTSIRHTQQKDNDKRCRAEANVSVAGRLIRAEESAMELEHAIVNMKHTLTRELRKWREKLIASHRDGARNAKAMLTDIAPLSTSKVDAWIEDWIAEEEKMRLEIMEEKDKKWSEWEESGEDQRDYV